MDILLTPPLCLFSRERLAPSGDKPGSAPRYGLGASLPCVPGMEIRHHSSGHQGKLISIPQHPLLLCFPWDLSCWRRSSWLSIFTRSQFFLAGSSHHKSTYPTPSRGDRKEDFSHGKKRLEQALCSDTGLGAGLKLVKSGQW